jgi:hypothetical protein
VLLHIKIFYHINSVATHGHIPSYYIEEEKYMGFGLPPALGLLRYYGDAAKLYPACSFVVDRKFETMIQCIAAGQAVAGSCMHLCTRVCRFCRGRQRDCWFRENWILASYFYHS